MEQNVKMLVEWLMPSLKHGGGNVVVWHALGLVKWQICTGLKEGCWADFRH